MAEKFKFAKNDKEFEEMFGDEFVDVQVLARNAGVRTSGSIKVDSLLGGGFPKGTMIELWGAPQCLAADTHIPFETRTATGARRCQKGGNIERLYERFHGLPHKQGGKGKYERPLDGDTYFYAPSIDNGGRILRNQIVNVLHSGEKECLEVTTLAGHKLTATAEHRFWTGTTFSPLHELQPGDVVYVHNNSRSRKSADDKEPRRLHTTARQSELRYIATPDTIVSIKPVGVRDTYDLVMAEPYHNFVAEGFVVHNSSKSTLALACIGNVLKTGGTACYVDLERGLDLTGEADYLEATHNRTDFEIETAKRARSSWLRKNGVDPFDPNFRIYDPPSGEQLFRFLANVIVLNKFDVVVVDSVAAILTEKQLEGDTGESTFGAVARLLTSEMPRLMRLYGTNQNTNIIFINQIRDKIGFMQQGQKSTGGHALEHYVGTKIRLRLVKREQQTSGDTITISKVQVNKSRYASAKEVEIEISGERGIDVLGELLEFAEQQGYAYSSGAWKYFFNDPIPPEVFKAAQKSKKVEELGGFAGKAQGKDAAKQWMGENGWHDKLYAEAVRVGIE